MKHSFSILVLTLTSTLLIGNECSISLEPRWESLERGNTAAQKFGGKWILAGSITFRKKCKDPIKLDHLCLAWHGPRLKNLSGSLYKKIPGKEFVPIEDNVLCDGLWNEKNQHLQLDFSDQSQNLGPLSIFYVVLTVPKEQEELLKQGHFTLVKHHLPEQFEEQGQDLDLNLAQLAGTQRKES